MNWGAARADIFSTDQVSRFIPRGRRGGSAEYALEVHGYCLMTNHYHLLLRSLDGRLTDGMRHLSSCFTQTLNYRRGRDGPLFRGRFASVRIGDDAHLVQASRYIHLNPVTAGCSSSAGLEVVECGRVRWQGAEPRWLTTGFHPQPLRRVRVERARGIAPSSTKASTARRGNSTSMCACRRESWGQTPTFGRVSADTLDMGSDPIDPDHAHRPLRLRPARRPHRAGARHPARRSAAAGGAAAPPPLSPLAGRGSG